VPVPFEAPPRTYRIASWVTAGLAFVAAVLTFAFGLAALIGPSPAGDGDQRVTTGPPTTGGGGEVLAADQTVVSGTLTRLGLDYDTLAKKYPRLIYCSISGFGHTGPWSQRPAYDAVVQGMSGLMAITGAAEGPPVKPGSPIADLAAGLYAFGGICAALRGGRGTHLDIALYDASVSLLEGAALAWLATGVEPDRMGNAHYSIAPFDTFTCADGDITICAANDLLFGATCTALGLPALLTDPRFATNALRHADRASLKQEMEAVLRTAAAAHWLAVLDAAGIPCGPISTVAEAVGSEQSLARQMVVDAGGIPVPGNPVKMSAWADAGVRPAAPLLDEHGPAIRAEFGPAVSR